MLSLLASLVLSASALASPAVSYTCVGINNANKQAVTFELLFSEHDREIGYANQSITITREGGMDASAPYVLQITSKERLACKKNPTADETYLPGSQFSMDPTRDGDLAPYQVSFKSKCAADRQYDVKAYCFFDN